jgi:hypothetical protein
MTSCHSRNAQVAGSFVRGHFDYSSSHRPPSLLWLRGMITQTGSAARRPPPLRRRPFKPQRQQNASRPSRGGSRPGTSPRHGAANARSRYESYLTMARDAASRGDIIDAENLFLHAEHYFRVLREHE